MTYFLKIPVYMSANLSADIMASLCSIRIHTNYFSKTSRPRECFFFITRRALAREGDYEMMPVCACVCECVSRF